MFILNKNNGLDFKELKKNRRCIDTLAIIIFAVNSLNYYVSDVKNCHKNLELKKILLFLFEIPFDF